MPLFSNGFSKFRIFDLKYFKFLFVGSLTNFPKIFLEILIKIFFLTSSRGLNKLIFFFKEENVFIPDKPVNPLPLESLIKKVSTWSSKLCAVTIVLIPFFSQKFDLIVSNPPYIKSRDLKKLEDDIKLYEPKIALDGGNDGLDLIKKVIYKAKEILKANGRLALEISNEQVLQVSKILEKNNFRIEYFVNDYKDNIRSLISILIK